MPTIRSLFLWISLSLIAGFIVSACVNLPGLDNDLVPPAAAVTSTPPATQASPSRPTLTLTETPAVAPTAEPTVAASPTLPPGSTSPPDSPSGEPVALQGNIQIRRVITTTGTFIRLDLDPLTNDIFYMDTEANIYRLSLQPDSGSTSARVYTISDIGGVPLTWGMTFGPDGTLYVVENDTQAYTNRAIIRQGIPNEAGERVWSTLASTAPYPLSNTFFDHRFSGILASPDGQYVYVSSGSRTDHGEVQSSRGTFPELREVPLTSAIFRIPTGVADLTLPNDQAELEAQGYLFADGLRNPFDLAFAPNGDLLAVDNGPDADFPEELNRIRQGQHYGFPWRFGLFDNPQQFPDYDPAQDPWIVVNSSAAQLGTYRNDPDFPPLPDRPLIEPVANLGPEAGHFRDSDGQERDVSEMNRPLYTFTPHRVPLGLSFDAGENLAEPFKGDAFLLSFGPTYETMTDQGRDLLHLELTKTGEAYQLTANRIVSGFTSPIDSLLLGNKLYVLEHSSIDAQGQSFGTMWEITLPMD